VYRWELDGPAQREFAGLSAAARASLAAFIDAVVIVDPLHYQCRRDERDDVSMPLRSRAAVTFCSRHLVIAMEGVDRFVDRATRATVQSGSSAARHRGIRAASAHSALSRSSHIRPVVCSNLTRST